MKKYWLFALLFLWMVPAHAEMRADLAADFQQAAQDQAIPVELLKAISFINTRLVDRQGVAHSHMGAEELEQAMEALEIEGSPDYFGVMGLRQAQAEQAAAILGVTIDVIKTDQQLNIRAAAVLLARIAEQQYPASDMTLGDYYSVVAHYIDFENKAMELLFADEVFNVLRQGVTLSDGNNVMAKVEAARLQPQNAMQNMPEQYQDQLSAPFARDGRLDSDVADRFLPSRHFSSRNGQRIRRIVLHTCEGSGAGCANFLTDNARSASAHYVVLQSGSVTQLVRENVRANHVRCCNSDSVGIEHGGFAQTNTWTEAQFQASFALICDIARRNNLPVNAQTIQSHAELDPSRRTDPGPFYPFARMFREVRACVNGEPTALPDLNINAFSWTPENPQVGDEVVFTAVINNAQAATQANVGVAFFVNDQQVGFDATTPLAANSRFTFTIREPFRVAQSGRFNVRVLVDDLSIVAESNENNNGFSANIIVASNEVELPDLVLESITWSPENPASDEDVTFFATVSNQGEPINGPVTTSFFVEQNLIGTSSIDALGSNESHTFTLQGRQPLRAGDIRITAFVDAQNAIAELNEDNNVLSDTVTVETRSDLVISNLTQSPLQPNPGDEVTFSATVTNLFNRNEANVGVVFFVDDENVGFDASSPLNAGETRVFTMRSTWSAVAGTFTVRALVDDLEQITEANEENNLVTSTLTIRAPEPEPEPRPSPNEILQQILQLLLDFFNRN